MAAGKPKTKAGPKSSLSRGRPPLSTSQKASLSSKATRSLIRSHHNLRKEHAKAVAAGDEQQARDIEHRIDARGGLSSYQIASTTGQSRDRGGDSSRVLVEWLKHTFEAVFVGEEPLHMLEVGALSTQNACSKVQGLDVRRIDLHSQEVGIEEIDFMDLAVPNSPDGYFDLISLSLVLNFVPDATARGEMLKRIPFFLHRAKSSELHPDLPCLFLVLPLPCVSNSRYLTEAKLKEILGSLGLILQKTKKTSKLYYSLWTFDERQSSLEKAFKKEELRSGGTRNNFAIILK
jgi:25S rRNA (adenine2142-N1)-methyltransferase